VATPEGSGAIGAAREGAAMHAKIRPAKATAKAVRNIEFSFECGFHLGYYQIQSATERQRFLDLADSARAKHKLGGFLDAVTTGGASARSRLSRVDHFAHRKAFQHVATTAPRMPDGT
jgi:hypothetical protein